ncbi:MAG: cellulase [Promethearchaeota archaeon CR_4]|nr:MAG: cellulase [Candidatus Lokiarchaeota archaeon CR_4]
MVQKNAEYRRLVVDRQRRLSETLGVSGYEDKVRDLIIAEIEPIVEKYWVDAMGNLIAIMGEPGKSPILLDAHLDEIGLMITHVTDQGFAYFTPIGGWDERLFLGQTVVAEPQSTRIHGVIGALPPHITRAEDRKKSMDVESLFIDFGFLTKDEADAAGVKVGSVCTLDSGFQELPGGRLKGKAFDDRTGCNILVQTACNLAKKELPHQVCFVWAVQEEVGTRGARTAAYALDEQYHITMAVACENTTAGDVPGVPPQRCPSRMGKGPAITLVDANTVVSKMVSDLLITTAEENKIPYQIKTPASGGTDAGAIHLTRAGIPSGVVSVPGRYIHSPATIIDIKDVLGAIDLVTAFTLMP